MRPLQTSSLPTRSKDIDFLRKDRAACQSRPEKELVLVDPPPHRRSGKARATIEIEVDGGADCLMTARKRLMLGHGDVNGPEEELQNGLRVVAEALVAGPRVAAGHARDDQRFAAERQRRVGGFERGHAPVAEARVAAEDARARPDD